MTSSNETIQIVAFPDRLTDEDLEYGITGTKLLAGAGAKRLSAWLLDVLDRERQRREVYGGEYGDEGSVAPVIRRQEWTNADVAVSLLWLHIMTTCEESHEGFARELLDPLFKSWCLLAGQRLQDVKATKE